MPRKKKKGTTGSSDVDVIFRESIDYFLSLSNQTTQTKRGILKKTGLNITCKTHMLVVNNTSIK